MLVLGSAVAQDFDDISLLPPDLREERQDNFGGLERMGLAKIDLLIEAADRNAAIPEPLKRYRHLDGKVAQIEGRFARSAEMEVGAVGNKYVVIKSRSNPYPERSFADVIAYDSTNHAYLRVRREPSDVLIRFYGMAPEKGAGSLEVFNFISWTAKVEDAASELHGCNLLLSEVALVGSSERFRAWRDGKLVLDERIKVKETTQLTKAPESLQSQPRYRRQVSFRDLLSDLFGNDDDEIQVDDLIAAAEPSNGERKPGEPEEFRDDSLNYCFKHPGGRFISRTAVESNPEAAFLLTRTAPALYFMLIPEEVGVSSGVSTESLESIAQDSVRSAAQSAEFSDSQEREVNGLRFRCFTVDAQLGRLQLLYRFHVISINGYFFQLVSWTNSSSDKEAFIREADALVENFTLVNPTRVSTGLKMDQEPLADPGSGIFADFSKMGGQKFPDLESEYPSVRYGSVFLNFNGSTLVVPLDLRGHEFDDEILAAGMMSSVGIEYPGQVRRVGEVAMGTAKGVEYRVEFDFQGNKLEYLIRILRNGDAACMVAAWVSNPKSAEQSEERLKTMVNCVEFREPDPDAALGEEHLTEPQRKARAVILNDCALEFFNRSNFATAAEVFRVAAQTDRKNLVISENLVEALERQGRYDEALAVFDEAEDVLGENPAWRACEARLLHTAGRSKQAVEKFAALFADGFKNEDDLLTYLTALVQLSRPEDAVSAVDAFIKGTEPSVRVRRWRAQVLTEAGKTSEALDEYRQLYKEHPDNGELLDDMVEALLTENEGNEALQFVELLEKSGTSTKARVHYLRGRAYLEKDDYRKAKEQFEIAKKEAPFDQYVEEGLMLASAGLGQGDNSLVPTPIEPVAIPDALAAVLFADPVKNPGNDSNEGYNSQVLSTVTGYFFQEGQPVRKTIHRKLRVSNQAGVRENATLQFSFDPVYESIFVNRLEVFDLAGERVATGQSDNYYVSGANAGDLATSERILHVPVPGLKAGYTLEFEVTTANKASSEAFPFERRAFFATVPTAVQAVFVRGDPASVNALTLNGEFETFGNDHFAAWVCRDSQVFQFESLMPQLDSFVPFLVLGDDDKSWEELGHQYLEDIADRLEPDDKVWTLAQKIVADADAESIWEKTEAVLQWVQNEISYQALEFGSRARIPNPSPKVISDRYGDCKDHSLLAREMLEAVGISCHLTLINSGARLHETLPSLDQFDHMILYSPEIAGGRFFDCTGKAQGFHLAAPQGLGGRRCLVLDPEKPRIHRVPAMSSEENQVRCVRRLRFGSDGSRDLLVSEEVTTAGYYGGWMRGYFQNSNAADYARNLQQVLGNLGKFNLKNVEVENLDEVAKPFVVRLEYRIRDALTVHAADEEAKLELPAIWEDYYLKPHYSAERRNPFHVDTPVTFLSNITFADDSAWQPSPSEASESGGDTVNFKWKVTQSGEGDWQRVGRLEISEGTHPRDEFKNYQLSLESALEGIKGTIALTRKEGGANKE